MSIFGHTGCRHAHLCHARHTRLSHPVLTPLPTRLPLLLAHPPAPDDPEGLEAQVAALLGAAGSLSAHAMAEADEALAPKVSTAEAGTVKAGALTRGATAAS